MSLERVGRLTVLCVVALVIVCGQKRSVSAQENFEAVAQAASAAREAGRVDEALRDYSQAVALRPDWAEGWWYLGTMLYDQDHYAEAIAPLKKLVELSPELGAAWAFLG